MKARAIRGSVWTMLGYGGQQFLRFCGNLVLARLLFPRAFGLMALVQVFMQGLQMFSDIGIGPSIIQSGRGEEERFLNTAWTIQFIRGFALWVGACILAYPISVFYNAPELVWLIPVSASTAAISGLNSTAIFTENRKLSLRRVTGQRLAAQLISMIITISWAFLDRSVLALVAGNIIGAVFVAATSHVWLEGIRHRLMWDKEAVQELFRFGRWVFVSTLLTFLAMQLDRVLLGRLVPLEVLGVYSMALLLVSLPQKAVAMVAAWVLFPLLSDKARSTDSRGYAERVEKARKPLLDLGVAVTIGLLLGSPLVFQYLYDARYSAAAWMGQLLCVYTWFSLLQSSADRALLAVGDSRAIAVSNAINVGVTAIGCLIGYKYGGMAGFICGLSASSLLSHVAVELALLRRGLNIIRQDIVYTATVAGIGCCGVIGGLLCTLRSHSAALAAVWSVGLVGVVVVWAGIRLKRTLV